MISRRPTDRSALQLLAASLLVAQGPALAQSPPEPPAGPADDAAAEVAIEAGAEPLPLDDLRTFTEVFAKIKSDYVEDVDDKTLLTNAIRGMLSGLDPHSTYLDIEDYRGLQEGTSGEFGGLGLEVGLEDGFIKVIAPIDGTPAAKAGVQAGDMLIKIDDRAVKGMSLSEAIEVMRGEPGTDIVLTLLREGEEQPVVLTVTRDVIKVRSVRGRLLEPGYGYVRISQFQQHTGTDINKVLGELKEENGAPLEGVVLDLRNNPGGVLGAAVAVADEFLEEGLIVYTEGRVEDAQMRFSAKAPDTLDGAPIVVLVNSGSASAAEIVAGALQDQKRALVIGRQTFGKGSVQTILPMVNDAAIKITTARYYTPSGRSIQAEGITPDIVLDNLRLTQAERPAIEAITEADLEGHLDRPGETAPAGRAEGGNGARVGTEDFALYEALNLLKGLNILEARSGQAEAVVP